MATFSGNAGLVKISTNTVAEVLDFSISQSVNIIDDSELTDAADTHLVGSTNWSGSVNCYWDDTDTNGQVAMTVGASVDLNLLPEGAGAGAAEYNGTATIESIEISAGRNSIVTASFTFTGNGALTIGTV